MSLRGRLDKVPVARPGQKMWTAAQFNALVEAVRLNLNITGPSVFADRGGIHIAHKRPKVQVQKWPGRVIANADLAPNQWIYSVNEVIKKTLGYGGWEDKQDGRQVQCFNRPEDGNSESGVQGTGINLDNLTGDFAHQPVPVGSIVEVTEVRLPAGPGGPDKSATVEYWIDRMNGVDGRCNPGIKPGVGFI